MLAVENFGEFHCRPHWQKNIGDLASCCHTFVMHRFSKTPYTYFNSGK